LRDTLPVSATARRAFISNHFLGGTRAVKSVKVDKRLAGSRRHLAFLPIPWAAFRLTADRHFGVRA
jgi:hypothetical protein